MLKVGIRANNLPDEIEKQVLLEHILKEYGRHTPMEIKLAFDMAIGNKLDISEKDVNAYENFSCIYFSKIMNAYRKWAKETHNQLKKDFPKMVEEKIILTDEEKAEWIMDWKVMPTINIELIPLMFYEFLTEKNIIKITTQEKWQYIERATQNVKSMLQEEICICKTNNAYVAYNKFCNEEKNGFTKEFKGRILNRAKRLIVYNYLKTDLA